MKQYIVVKTVTIYSITELQIHFVCILCLEALSESSQRSD